MVYEPVPFSTRRDFPISREFPLAPGFQNASFFNKLQLAPSFPLQCAKQISRLRDPGQIHEIQFRSQSQLEETQFEMSAPSLNRVKLSNASRRPQAPHPSLAASRHSRNSFSPLPKSRTNPRPKPAATISPPAKKTPPCSASTAPSSC
jgi:hypothetical protein